MTLAYGLATMLSVTAKFYGVSSRLLFRQPLIRRTELVEARLVIYHLCRTELGWGYLRTARQFGVHHTTVMYAIRRFDELCTKSPRLLSAVTYVETYCRHEGVFTRQELH